MGSLISDLIPLICGVYFLLMFKGIIKVSPEKQARFDEYLKDKRKSMIIICYVLIVIALIFITKDLFFVKPK